MSYKQIVKASTNDHLVISRFNTFVQFDNNLYFYSNYLFVVL
jgi:hypothetical protein